ncbi:hillarin-like [Babylonia areolata]|uniref:hillarin-like n=1 Tax=Babylonia areolata TaxID=304850 RepID=UPI003FD2707D
MATLSEEDAASRGFKRLSSLFLPPHALGAGRAGSRCQRCGVNVYQQERMGPVHDVVFHKTCFRCFICGQFLTLKTYWSNQVEGGDAEIYCHTHVPRIGGSGMDREALGIRRAVAAQQDVSSGAVSRSSQQVRQTGGAPPPMVDKDALGIRSAVSAQRTRAGYEHTPQSHTSGVDASALHIRGALDAQRLQRRYQKKRTERHHFPPHIAKKREELFDAQKQLEERMRREEDELFRTFHHERQEAKSVISQEIDQEWEQRLRDLADKYEHLQDKKKAKKMKDHEKKIMTMQFESEKKDLEQKMTQKRRKITQTATLRLREKEQRATSDLVTRQSQQMLNMLAAKHQEIRQELEQTLQHAEPLPSESAPRQNGTIPPLTHNNNSNHNNDHHDAHPIPPSATIALSTTSSTSPLAGGGGKEGEEGPSSREQLVQEVMEEVLQLPPVAVVRPSGPHPPACRKRELIPDESLYAAIDEQVIKVAEGEQPTYTDLVRQLTEDLVTDLEKVRAIYRWITVKDLDVMEFADDIDAESPMGLLRGIKFGTETYHVLFMRLCSYAGLHCVEVKGHSKSVGYEPGMTLTPDIFHNTWNAVLLAGDWRLIQCNWGARHLVLSKDRVQEKERSKEHIRYQYDEHYFLTDPDEFVQEFMPFDPSWQLLEKPISMAEFESLPFVRSIFFQYGMHFDGRHQAVLETDERGSCKVSIKIPEEYENDMVFYYQLRFADRTRSKDVSYQHASLERFVFQTMVENSVTFSVHVPVAAEYYLEIFANKIDDSGRVEENNAVLAPFRLKCACKFKIVCKEMTGKTHPLPNCGAGEWGPRKALRHFGITPVLSKGEAGDGERIGFIIAEDKFQLQLRMPRPLQFVAKLKMNQVEEKVLDPFIHVMEADSLVTITASLPQPGQYGLDVYARPKAAANKVTLGHTCKFLINCVKVSRPVNIPRLPEPPGKSKWGPTPAFEMYGLELVSHKDPKVGLAPGVNSVTIQLHVPPGIQLSYQFLREPDEDNRDHVSMVRDAKRPQVVRFQVATPKAGNYMLCLYARREDSEDRALPNVFNYLLQSAHDAADSEDSSSSMHRKSSIFQFFSKKDKSAKDRDRNKDRFSDKSSDRSSERSS